LAALLMVAEMMVEVVIVEVAMEENKNLI